MFPTIDRHGRHLTRSIVDSCPTSSTFRGEFSHPIPPSQRPRSQPVTLVQMAAPTKPSLRRHGNSGCIYAFVNYSDQSYSFNSIIRLERGGRGGGYSYGHFGQLAPLSRNKSIAYVRIYNISLLFVFLGERGIIFQSHTSITFSNKHQMGGRAGAYSFVACLIK